MKLNAITLMSGPLKSLSVWIGVSSTLAEPGLALAADFVILLRRTGVALLRDLQDLIDMIDRRDVTETASSAATYSGLTQ